MMEVPKDLLPPPIKKPVLPKPSIKLCLGPTGGQLLDNSPREVIVPQLSSLAAVRAISATRSRFDSALTNATDLIENSTTSQIETSVKEPAPVPAEPIVLGKRARDASNDSENASTKF